MTDSSILTVTQLTQGIKNLLESRFSLVKVQGEITNITYQSSGHIYFSLKDEGAQLSSVLFKGSAQSLTFKPKSGDKVVVAGEISVYPPRGSYQLIVKSMKLAGIGELLLRLHELKKDLEARGYFSKERKKALPPHPKRIGIITSPTGAVIQDIINVLKRRRKSFSLVLYPVKVQGEGAAKEIAQAIYEADLHKIADILIVGRGGGSLEDLFAFNEKEVADALFSCSIPTISAVGHETDFSIADFVADLRAPTPSAAAEIAFRETEAELEHLRKTSLQLASIIKGLLKQHALTLEKFASHPLLRSPYALLGVRAQKIDEMEKDIAHAMALFVERKRNRLTEISSRLKGHHPRQKLTHYSQGIRSLFQQIEKRIQESVLQRKKALTNLIAHLDSIDPKNLLRKGYCISFDEKSRSVIIGAQQVKPGMELSLLYHDGEVKVTAGATSLSTGVQVHE